MNISSKMRMISLLLIISFANLIDAVCGLAPVNPYNGTQLREEIYEFTKKPSVKKEGDKWVIIFESKGYCDATVSILDKEGRIIRHLASGVLGKNAPWPFQQNSLTQKIEWDGQDDMGNVVTPEVLKGCKVKVSLGLKAKFERNIGWEPANFPGSLPPNDNNWAGELKDYVIGKAQDGSLYILGYSGLRAVTGGNIHGRVFKDGKYVKTFWPPSAKDIKKLPGLGFKLAETIWGDKVLITGGAPYNRYGLGTMRPAKALALSTLEEVTKGIFDFAGITGQKVGNWPAEVPGHDSGTLFYKFFRGHMHRMAVDRINDDLYISGGMMPGLRRINGKTGEFDNSWFPNGDFDKVSELCFGPDGYLYVGVGNMGYNQFIFRVDREGKPVPFTGNGAVPLPNFLKPDHEWHGGGGQYGELEGSKNFGRVCPNAFGRTSIKALWTGGVGHSNVHDRGMYVSARGDIIAGIQWPYGGERGIKYGIPQEAVFNYQGLARARESFVAVWDRDGNILTLNAVGDTLNGHGVTIDRDRNIYAVWASRAPVNCKGLFGLVNIPLNNDYWGGFGTIAKFRGGVPFPRAKVFLTDSIAENAFKLSHIGKQSLVVEPVENSLLWTYTGVIGQAINSCTCHHLRYDMDYYSRHWLPANYLYSIIVLDANANIIARLGRYGNVDDTEEDLKEGRDGLRFVWPRNVAVSDKSLYVNDHNARRILKATIFYSVEETVSLP